MDKYIPPYDITEEMLELTSFGRRRYLQAGNRYSSGSLSKASLKKIRQNITVRSGFRRRKASRTALSCSCSTSSKRQSPILQGIHTTIRAISAIKSGR